LRGYALAGGAIGEPGGLAAVALVEHWTGQRFYSTGESAGAALDKAQAWFHETYPNSPKATPLPTLSGKWDIDDLTRHLRTPTSRGDAARGAAVYAKANCAKCHRFGETGESHGPDLTSVAKRFSKREILEAILFPSHVVSDQYASKSVRTTDGRVLSGLAAITAEGDVLLRLPTLETVQVPRDEVEDIAQSSVSSMPEKLLDPLTLDEITDLFAYLAKPPATNVARQPGERARK
jgi:putative heme-binding domain-containing protein